MSYEFYIDQFLAEHFLTGFLLLQLSAVLQKKEVSLIRIAAGSLCNSATSAFCICAGIPFGSLAGMLAGGGVVCGK
ncbi:MAG: hypothetical protein SOX32_01440, partial [Candidatus Choladocola sp.]|nr:hypothetical protein [Candidatus Choladocola sp.]